MPTIYRHPTQWTMLSLDKLQGKFLQRPNWFPVPSFALKLALGEKASLVLEGQRAIPQRLLEIGYEFKFNDLDAALRDLTRS